MDAQTTMGLGNRVDIVEAARSNDAFRREVLTGEHEQVVVMTIPPGGEIGEEVHPKTDQVLAFIDGRGEAVLDGGAATLPGTTSCSSEPGRGITS